MRIISGTAGGFRLKTLSGPHTRPTTDKVKEALFSKLSSYNMLVDAVVVDLFAGSGALGLEAASRGAKRVDFVEKNHAAASIVQHNIDSVSHNVETELTLYEQSALSFLKTAQGSYDLMFIDPPYQEQNLKKYLEATTPLLETHSLLVVERSVRSRELIIPNDLKVLEVKKYGETELVFLELKV
ncbi:MAG: 16S rRNA (guanine(966)-N(2))-methyltransferase RsmD [Micrococcaceae bacterium]